MLKKPELLTFSDCLRFAKSVELNEGLFTRRMETRSAEELASILSRAQQALKVTVSTKNRRLLKPLVRVLKVLNKAEAKRQDEPRQRALRMEAAEKRRSKLAKMVKGHPSGRLIGATQTITYKTPGSNLIWATARKRRA
jgi:hypothetical protein